jgi:c-di-GMP-binding flagellar brake protein YcgR
MADEQTTREPRTRRPTRPATELRMELGQPALLQIAGDDQRYRTRFYGMVPNEYIFLRMPVQPGIRPRLEANAEVVVRYIHDGVINGFVGVLERHFLDPTPILILAYPNKLESLSLRDSERVLTFIPAEGTLEGQHIRGEILDLSGSGCKFVLEEGQGPAGRQPPSEDDERPTINLTFGLPATSELVSAPGYVAAMERDRGRLVLGVEFARMDEKSAELVQGFIDHVKRVRG